MMWRCRRGARVYLAGSLATAVWASFAGAAEPQLYETGPAIDSSFVRFVNGTEMPLEVRSNRKTSLSVPTGQRVSAFFPVRAGASLAGELSQGSARRAINMAVKAGQFVTVVGSVGEGGSLLGTAVVEPPAEFTSLRASLALYNLDSTCAKGQLLAVTQNALVFPDVPPGSAQRRVVNPIGLKVQAQCGGVAAGASLDLGHLEAGKRYSVFLAKGPRGSFVFAVTDAIAR